MLKLRIETKNDAFAKDLTFEISRLLYAVADKIREDAKDVNEGILRDWNGNPCGKWKLTKR